MEFIKMCMKFHVGITLVLAVALFIQHTRVERRKKERKTLEIQSFLQRDDVEEENALKRPEYFPIGCQITTKTNGVGIVAGYNNTTNTYAVQFTQKTSVLSLKSVEIESVVVKDLFIYPIKSCRGIRLTNAQLTARGIANDRLWMFTDSQGTFITQRRYPTMALIEVALDNAVNPSMLTLCAPSMPQLVVPIIFADMSRERSVRVWKSQLLAIDQGDEAAKWINKYLEGVREKNEFRLVRLLESCHRQTKPKYAPGYETGFADAYPYLLSVEASLQELNTVLTEPITMNRFRPNIVLSGAPAFADESWNCIAINGIRFRNVKPCDRCNVPCVDPMTGIRHDCEPKATLIPLRNGEKLGFVDGTKHTYYFGSNMIAEERGEIFIGAPVKILTMKQSVHA